jgi:hypothetical protein
VHTNLPITYSNCHILRVLPKHSFPLFCVLLKYFVIQTVVSLWHFQICGKYSLILMTVSCPLPCHWSLN